MVGSTTWFRSAVFHADSLQGGDTSSMPSAREAAFGIEEAAEFDDTADSSFVFSRNNSRLGQVRFSNHVFSYLLLNS